MAGRSGSCHEAESVLIRNLLPCWEGDGEGVEKSGPFPDGHELRIAGKVVCEEIDWHQPWRNQPPGADDAISYETAWQGTEKGARMSESRAKHWESLKEQGFIPLCSDWNADGSEMICDIFMDGGFGCAECISFRQAYRKDEDGNIEYYR